MSRWRNVLLLLFALLLLLASGCSPEAGLHEVEMLPLTGDLIVVGSGIAGLTAALEAARHGASVILCYDEPQDDRWMWNDGALHTGDDAADGRLEEALAAFGNGQGKTWHHELLARRADEDLAWLVRETGLSLVPEGTFRLLPENISYAQAQRHLLETALGEGIRLVEGAVLQELILGDRDSAAGITFLDPSGVHHTAYAPAIILADGGYLNDREWLQELNPGITVASWRCGREGAGVQLARAAGLDLVDETKFSYALAIEEEQKWVAAVPPPAAVLIIDEQVLPVSQQADAGMVQLLLNSTAGRGYLLVPEAALGPGHELNWPRYAGVDAFMESYQLQFPLLRRWFSQPYGYFYGCPVKAAAAYCLGGIAVDESGTVLREGRPVEGLYAIGETAGGLNGAALMPGTALTEALVWGRHVGEAVARWVQK